MREWFRRLRYRLAYRIAPEWIDDLEHRLSTLLCEVTGGRLSKCYYPISVMLDEVHACRMRECDECGCFLDYTGQAGTRDEPCHMCLNAKVDGDLTDNTDLSYHGIGESYACDRRLMFASGNRMPPRILFEERTENGWSPVGVYNPRFCPNCGREIKEYSRKEANTKV